MLIDYITTIKDMETGAVIFANVECQLECNIDNDDIYISAIYLWKQNEDALASLDPITKLIALHIQDEAVNNDEFCSIAFEKLENQTTYEMRENNHLDYFFNKSVH